MMRWKPRRPGQAPPPPEELERLLRLATPQPPGLSPEARHALFQRALVEAHAASRRAGSRPLAAWRAVALLLAGLGAGFWVGHHWSPAPPSTAMVRRPGAPGSWPGITQRPPAAPRLVELRPSGPVGHGTVRRMRRGREQARPASVPSRIPRRPPVAAGRATGGRWDEERAATEVRQPPRLFVMVTPAPRLRVTVRSAPPAAPGYARATAVRRDRFGAMSWAQATVSSEGTGSRLILRSPEGENR
jgi:hypothetical protein